MPIQRPVNGKAVPAQTDENKKRQALASLQAMGGVEQGELKVPAVVLMQGQSPQLKTSENAKVGTFFHPTLDMSLGKELRVVVIRKRMRHELWGDRDSKQGLFATADEKGVWDKPHHSFKATYSSGAVTYETKGSLKESGLDNWGSYDPKSTNKKKAAALTYELVLWLLDHPELSPVMVTFRRMPAVRTQEQLMPRIVHRAYTGEAVHDQIYRMRVVQEEMRSNTFYTVGYSNDGVVKDPELSRRLYDLTEQLGQAVLTPDVDEGDEAPAARRGPVDYSVDDPL